MPETFHAGPNLGQLSDVTVIHGDCIEAMRELPDDSIEAIVTDPPYGLGFMGKEWDALPPGLPWAQECLRVLKPGGHLLAFGGTRTWHRLAVAVEDAGFEIRDSIAWLYGSGFPKSLDVSKAIDKAAGATREVVGTVALNAPGGSIGGSNALNNGERYYPAEPRTITAPATPEAEQWQGWGTALKPAFEPVVVGRKPFRGNVAANVLAHGTGALNIDACRIETTDNLGGGVYSGEFRRKDHYSSTDSEPGAKPLSRLNRGIGEFVQPAGRWPANVVLDESQAAALDEQTGDLGGASTYTRTVDTDTSIYNPGHGGAPAGAVMQAYGDSGGASRFFYCAKAPKKERPVTEDGTSHATVKPLTLMRWLVRLVTPPGGVVLDPFAGSGTTVEAALQEGFRVIGIEREADYLPMIQQRIARTVSDV